MKKREFDKTSHNILSVKYRRAWFYDYKIYEVIGCNSSERLFKLKDEKMYGGVTWVRCESVIVFEIKTTIK